MFSPRIGFNIFAFASFAKAAFSIMGKRVFPDAKKAPVVVDIFKNSLRLIFFP